MFLLRAAVATVPILVAVPCIAQDMPTPELNPRFEASFGYQGKVPIGTASSKATGSFGASFGWESRDPSFGLMVLCDTIGVATGETLGTRFDYSVLAGPRVRFPASRRLQPFAQALFGVVGSAGGSSASNATYPHPRPGPEFQAAPSMGLDLRVSRSFTLRLAQVEYRSFVGGDRADRLSVYSGVVFGIGHRNP
jgi:hypothetical protein